MPCLRHPLPNIGSTFRNITDERRIMEWVLISGGNGVLGQAYACVLEEDGYSVLSLDNRPPTNGAHPSRAWFECDITNEGDIKKLEAHVESLGGQIRGLVNNASCQPEGFGRELEDYA